MTANVIFIHPDGADPSHFAAARFESVGPDGRLNWDSAPVSSVYLGHLDDAIVATSNAGAVVHAYGIKAVAPSFGFDENGDEYTSLAALQGQNVEGSADDATILEEAAAAGRPTALIQSGFIAEPGTGVFFADAVSRGDREGITIQLFFDAESDGTIADDAQPRAKYNVIMGAGEQDFLPEGVDGVFGEGTRTDGRNLIEIAEDLGYTVVYNQAQLDALDPSTELVLGLFAADDTFNEFPEGDLIADGFVDGNGELVTYGQPVADAPNPDGLVLDTDGDGFTDPPTVGDMLEATLALDLFAEEGDEEGEGFFIVLEEEGTDNFGNTNNARGAIDATLRADQAIGAARDFVESVQPNTFVVTAADSAGGSLEIDDVSGDTVGTTFAQAIFDEEGNAIATEIPFDGTTGSDTAPFVAAPDANGDVFEFGISWAGLPDFAGSIVTKAFGEGADRLSSTIDNTGIYRLMYESLFDVSLDAPEGVPDDLAPREAPEPTAETGNVIFVHPDGTSPSHYAAARFASQGADGRLNWDQMSNASVYLGHMEDRLVGTSNGGAVVHAFGVKPFAGSFGLDEEGNPITSLSGQEGITIMEEAQAAGKAVGIVNSGFIAEPGSGVFLADAVDRGETQAITAEILESGAEVILGAGERDYLPAGVEGVFGEGEREDGRNLIEEAEDAGYTVVYTLAQLEAAAADPETEKLLGIFGEEDTYNDTFEDNLEAQGLVDANGDLVFYGQPVADAPNPDGLVLDTDGDGFTDPPAIADMMDAALQILDRDPDGFFLVLEEEATDNFGNNNNAAGVIEAAIRADDAIGVAMDFVDNTDPNTLIITAADSDAGGLEVDDVPIGEGTFGLTEPESDFTIRTQAELTAFGPDADGTLVELDDTNGSGDGDFVPFTTGAPDADGDVFDFGVAWATLSDVNGGIVSKTYGLNADLLPDTTDNTDIYRVMYETLFGIAAEDAADIADQKLVFGSNGDDVLDSAVDPDFDGAADLVFAGAGDDLVDTSTSRFGENRAYAGSDDDELFASIRDRLFGGAGNDILDLTLSQGGNRAYGGTGDDDFFNGNDDRLVGGAGSDRFFLGEESGESVVTGGAGADQFWIANVGIPMAANTITDFVSGEDVLGVAGIGASFATLDLSQDGDNALIGFGGDDLAVLLNVDSTSLTASDFAFV